MQRLREANVPAVAISVSRRAGAEPAPAELPTLSRVFWSGLLWSIVGAVIGGGLGLIVGLLGWGLPGTPSNIGIQIASWAMFWHVLGALLGCYLVLDTGDRFARKADHHDGPLTLVRVSTSDAELRSRAMQILVDAGGAPFEPA